MVKPKVRYFQTCDFCHKEYETDEKGMFNIKLPGIHIGERGEKSRTIVSGAICSECMDRLMDSLKEFIDLKEGEYIGNVFSWSKKKEDMAEWISVNDRLPETADDVLVALSYTYSGTFCDYSTARYIEFDDGAHWCESKHGYLEWDRYSDGHGGSSSYKVIAWMPIPTYAERKEENEQ